ncbi:MAG: hypothetical protein R6U61_03925, partial [Thermoplasmata archaeon]
MEKKIYWLVLLPSVILSSVIIISHPFKIVDSRYGWTYETTSSFFGPLIFFYIFILMVIAVLAEKSQDMYIYLVSCIGF